MFNKSPGVKKLTLACCVQQLPGVYPSGSDVPVYSDPAALQQQQQLAMQQRVRAVCKLTIPWFPRLEQTHVGF